MTPFDLDTILADFFALLAARRFHDCELLLRSPRDNASSPVEHAWLDYLEAILLSEKPPPRWDLAEKKLRHLLNVEIPDQLLARVHLEVAFGADYLGDYAQAIEHNRKSQQLFERLGDQEYVAKVLKNTGIAHTRAFERGQADRAVLDQALDCHRHSLALARSCGNETLADTVELELGTVYKALNRWDEARRQYTFRAARCRRSRPPGWQRSLALTLDNLGEVYYHLGRWPHAHTCYETALRLLSALPNPDPYEDADVWANVAQLNQVQGRMTEAVAASDKAIRLVETLRDPLLGERARIGFLGSRIRIYEQRVLLDLARGDPHAALTTLERAKARAFVELLAGYAPPDLKPGEVMPPEQAALRQAAPLDAAGIQQRLPPDTALIEYMVAPEQAVVFVASRNDLTVVPLAASLYEDLNRVFERNRHRLKQMAPDHEGILHTPWPLPLLHKHLMTPLAQLLTDWHRLVIVPNGQLHYIPFHALFAQSSGDRGPEIIHAPSATVLLNFCCAKPAACGRGGVVFSVGHDLRYVAREGAAVAARLGGAWFHSAAATTAAVIHESANHPVLHFACHAHFDAADPLASGLTLADGRLTMRQVLNELHLAADLVVLSACETGQSRLHRGDELIGLARAFIYAGTPSVLVSLWPVDDITTCLLMETFYDQLLAGHSLAASLVHAQHILRTMSTPDLYQRLIASGLSPEETGAEIARLRQSAAKLLAVTSGSELLLAHPFYWAPFMLVGDRLATLE